MRLLPKIKHADDNVNFRKRIRGWNSLRSKMKECNYVMKHNHGFVSRNGKKGGHIISQHYEELQEFHVNVDKKVFRTFPQVVFETEVFLWLPEGEWKILSTGVLWDVLMQDNQSQMVFFFMGFIIPYCHNFEPNICPKTCGWSSKGYEPRGISVYCCCSPAKSKGVLHTCEIYGCNGCAPKAALEWTVTFVTPSFGSSIRSFLGAGLKWCRQHANWTVSTLCSRMSPDLPCNQMTSAWGYEEKKAQAIRSEINFEMEYLGNKNSFKDEMSRYQGY